MRHPAAIYGTACLRPDLRTQTLKVCETFNVSSLRHRPRAHDARLGGNALIRNKNWVMRGSDSPRILSVFIRVYPPDLRYLRRTRLFFLCGLATLRLRSGHALREIEDFQGCCLW